MLNLKQTLESVKSSSQSKNYLNSLIGNYIKSKLYLLMLLTVTTGGISIGNIIIPGLVPPVQAGEITIYIDGPGKIRNLGALNSLKPGDSIRVICREIVYGGTPDHLIKLVNKHRGLQSTVRHLNYAKQTETVFQIRPDEWGQKLTLLIDDVAHSFRLP